MILIVKPGEDSNRGNGIEICNDFYDLKRIISGRETHNSGKEKTYIVQQYIDKPFLFNKRKFDLRCYMLMTHYNKVIKAYWYQEGYIRTCSREFNKVNIYDKLIHLTNDAVQNKAEDYGKFESGNKLSFQDFQKYLDVNHKNL